MPKDIVKDYPISITTDGVFDSSLNAFTPTIVNGKISVTEGTAEPPTTDTTLTVIDKTAEQGTGMETIEVPIAVSNNTGILGMTIKVSYAEGLILTNAVKGDALSSLTFTRAGNYAANPFNLVWDGQDSADTSNGVVAILTFTVPKDIVKDYPISITTDGVFDGDLKGFKPTVVNGKISVVGNVAVPPVNVKKVELNKYFTYDITINNLSEDVILLYAFFDENNKLIYNSQEQCNGAATLIVPKNLNAVYGKIFVWSSLMSMKPIIECVKLTY